MHSKRFEVSDPSIEIMLKYHNCAVCGYHANCANVYGSRNEPYSSMSC